MLTRYHIVVENYCKNKELELELWLAKRVGLESFKPGLDRIRPLFQPVIRRLQASGVKVITVGGTNGKGEVCFNIEKMLNIADKRVGLWTSPHILSIRERFRFLSQNCNYRQLKEAFLEENVQIERFGLSYYEFLFYIFLKQACNANCDYLVLEVGLGGRFDAVNLIDPSVCAITSIGRDHQEILGNSYRKILDEKLGITRSGTQLFTALDLTFLQQCCSDYCKKWSIPWINMTIPGSYFEQNLAMASEISSYLLGKKTSLVEGALSKGRFEKACYKGKKICFVGSHNLAGMRSLVEGNDWSKVDQILLAFSKRDTKEIQSCIKLLSSLEKEIILTSFDHPKAAQNIKGAADWKSLLDDEQKKNILITGSYYFVGEVQKYILDNS